MTWYNHVQSNRLIRNEIRPSPGPLSAGGFRQVASRPRRELRSPGERLPEPPPGGYPPDNLVELKCTLFHRNVHYNSGSGGYTHIYSTSSSRWPRFLQIRDKAEEFFFAVTFVLSCYYFLARPRVWIVLENLAPIMMKVLRPY